MGFCEHGNKPSSKCRTCKRRVDEAYQYWKERPNSTIRIPVELLMKLQTVLGSAQGRVDHLDSAKANGDIIGEIDTAEMMRNLDYGLELLYGALIDGCQKFPPLS
jgi:hypothetical protein